MADIEKEALAGMAKVGAPRSPMGREGTKFSSPSSKPAAGKLRPRGNAAAGDPAYEGQGTRKNVPVERHGAKHTIITNIVKQNDPAAGLTQANGRVIPSAIKRTADSFGQGIGTSY
jgi:hypothetical protein